MAGSNDTKRVIRVFIGSPNDLTIERRAFKNTIGDLNAGFGRGADVEFEPLGWEDALSQVGRRSQSAINADVDACDVFVLVMWRRWGQEAPDAEERGFTSYTEEEFYRALTRFEKTGAPTILVFFKDIASGQMADAGPQLKKVLAFRKNLEQTRKVLYRPFADENAFKQEIDRHLVAFAKGQIKSPADELRVPLLPDSALAEIEQAKAEAKAALERAEKAEHEAKNADARAAAAESTAQARADKAALALAERATKAALEGEIEPARQDFAAALEGTTSLHVLNLGAEFFSRIGEQEEAERLLQRWLAISGPDAQTAATAHAYGNLGLIRQTRGELDEAERMHRRALEIDEKLGHLEGMARHYGNLGVIHDTRGQLDEAERMHQKALAIHEKLGHLEGMASDYGNLGLIHRERGELDEAERMLRKSLEIDEKLGRLVAIARTYGNLGEIYETRGDLDEAERLHRKSLAIEEKLGGLKHMPNQFGNLGPNHETRGELDETTVAPERTEKGKREAVPTHPDEPAVNDLLGRKAFAEALAERLRYIKKENEEASEKYPFLMNLYGAWGTGKTSILNFLKQDLQRGDGESSEPPWVVIEINAWRNQDTGPSWFTLMDAVFRQSRKQLWQHDKWRTIRLCALEYSWRFLKRCIWWLFAVVTILLVVFWIERRLATAASPTPQGIAQWVKALTAIGGVVVLMLTRTRALLPGSARVAEEFVQAQSDPSQKLAGHFNDLVKRIGRPVAIFVDDLDRCRAPHVVELLETIQTLYRQAPVFYVVAADRNWLCNSFEMIYEGFKGSVGTPGRPLGHLFIEKVFQLSAAVPPLDDDTRDVFWQQLIESGASPDPQQTEQLQREAAEVVNAAESEDEILAKLKAPAQSREQLEALRRAAAIHLASPKIAATIEHALSRFASLAEANPRSMKRLVNAYGVQRTVAILRGVIVPGGELALWTILRLRWPLLADHIEDHPDAIDLILAKKPVSNLPKDLGPLAEDPAVLRVLSGYGVDESITTDSVRKILNPSMS